MLPRFKIALITMGEYEYGGVASVGRFLHRIISSSEKYSVQLFSLETAYNNPINLRLLAPKSWLKGIQFRQYTWHDTVVTHIGAYFSELEFQRYMPRRPLTELLNQFDLIQIVGGSPAVANVARNINKPVCLFMATMVRLERKAILQKARFPRDIYGQIMLPIVSRIERQALKRVNHIFAETEYTRQAILPYANASKVSIDTIGVDTQQFHPTNEKLRTDDYILSVGRFEDVRKNVSMLFEAYAILRKNMPDAPKLVLAGKAEPIPTVWTRAAALGITDHLVIKKDVPFAELLTLYQNAAVYVLSSDEEGLGIVLIEAMACATPVISTRCGGPDSVISDKIGFLTPIGDAQTLAERIQWMLQNPNQRRIMGQAGRKMVESRFSDQMVGQKYLNVYDGLLRVNPT